MSLAQTFNENKSFSGGSLPKRETAMSFVQCNRNHNSAAGWKHNLAAVAKLSDRSHDSA